jgi:low affinity Fe/Cu permease
MAKKGNWFVRFAQYVSHVTGRPIAFILAVGAIVVWGCLGPVFGYSDTWQLVINTATTIITFLMVFVLQNSQNRDGEALQAKLDELIYAMKGADNRFVQAEKLTDAELHALREKLTKHMEATSQELERRTSSRTPRKNHEPA